MGTTALGVMRGTGAHHALLDLTLQTGVGLSQLVCLRPQLGNFVLLDVRARVSSAAGSEEACDVWYGGSRALHWIAQVSDVPLI